MGEGDEEVQQSATSPPDSCCRSNIFFSRSWRLLLHFGISSIMACLHQKYQQNTRNRPEVIEIVMQVHLVQIMNEISVKRSSIDYVMKLKICWTVPVRRIFRNWRSNFSVHPSDHPIPIVGLLLQGEQWRSCRLRLDERNSSWFDRCSPCCRRWRRPTMPARKRVSDQQDYSRSMDSRQDDEFQQDRSKARK